MTEATRISLSVNKRERNVIERAAALNGQSLSDFARITVVSRAQQVLNDGEQTVLSDRERDRFLAMLDADIKPNAALKRAVKLYRRVIERRT